MPVLGFGYPRKYTTTLVHPYKQSHGFFSDGSGSVGTTQAGRSPYIQTRLGPTALARAGGLGSSRQSWDSWARCYGMLLLRCPYGLL